MKHNEYIVTLTNGLVQHDYHILASGEEQAIILAQAEAIKNARGYELVAVNEYKYNKGVMYI